VKGRPDFYWRKSKQQGYPARSVYKLQEIQEKFKPIKPNSRVLDIGASPGSWSLYVLDAFSPSSVTGVDLNWPDAKLLSRKGYDFIRGDFFQQDVLDAMKADGPYNVVLSDAAPSTSGNRMSDTAKSKEIGLQVIQVCRDMLCMGGSVVLKIFQGGEEKEILDRMRALFAEARAFKPKASRNDSMEIYFVGLDFRPPANV
jgi:23S rRNA (uridine2552-2'-O)-methyltransferase